MTHTAMAVVTTAAGALLPMDLVASARDYATAAKSPATRRAYASAWRQFAGWCEAHTLANLPAAPATVALYLSHLADRGRRVACIDQALAAISQAHKLAGLESPRGAAVVREVAAGIRRTLGAAPQRKAAVRAGQLRAMVAAAPAGLLGLRDRALLLLGWAAALRRAELVALDVADVVASAEGLTITIRRSKTDQDGAGHVLGVPMGVSPATCPVRAVAAWLAAATITEGALFRAVTRHGHLGGRLSDRGVARIVQRQAEAIGLEAATVGGHSLRAGLITEAAAAGVAEHVIASQSRHKSVAILRRYIREANVFTANAAAGLL